SAEPAGRAAPGPACSHAVVKWGNAMRVLMAMLSASWLFTASADEVYFVELKEFKQWPAPAQQAYVLGAVDQALVDAYLFDAASYRRIVECMSNVDTNAMFQSTLEGILKETYED